MISLTEKINLIKMKVDILKLKANDHDWQCYTPPKVKEELEKTLAEIEEMLKETA